MLPQFEPRASSIGLAFDLARCVYFYARNVLHYVCTEMRFEWSKEERREPAQAWRNRAGNKHEEEIIRIISARKASTNDVRRYQEEAID